MLILNDFLEKFHGKLNKISIEGKLMEWKKFKKIKYLHEKTEGSKSCIVLFHGYGADAEDLIVLAQSLYFSEDVDFIFPQGVRAISLGSGVTGRAWFQMQSVDFENISSQLSDHKMISDVKNVLEQIKELLNHLGSLYEKIFIGGFSQGAILVTHSFYRINFIPKALLILSGSLILPSLFPTLPESLKIPFFQSHGTQDNLLRIDGARRLHEKLLSVGLKGLWYEFQGGHGVPEDVASSLNNFMIDLLNDRSPS